MGDFVLEGEPEKQLLHLARHLKKAGEVELGKALQEAIKVAAEPLIEDAKSSADSTLPHGNGLAKRVTGAAFNTRYLVGRNPGVRLRGKDRKGKSIDLNSLDRGRLRHPTFGRRGKGDWHDQSVEVGWWSKPMEAGVPRAYAAILAAAGLIAEKLNRAA